jgi:hypothetical protein
MDLMSKSMHPTGVPLGMNPIPQLNLFTFSHALNKSNPAGNVVGTDRLADS